MHTKYALVENKGFLCLLIFPCMLDEGNLEKNKGFLCLLIFPCMLDEGNLEDKSVPHYL
jgi:ferredoxin-thioredoxin reductase catalytic subunit